MRASIADPVEFPELPIGRLHRLTIHRLSTAKAVHHRAGPWARCSEDDARMIRVGIDLAPSTPAAAVVARTPGHVPLVLHRRDQPAFA